MDRALRAIADPRRREIMRLVRGGELPAGKIAARFDVSRPAISQHLRILKEAGLLLERRDGARRFYRLRPEGMEEIHAFVEAIWALRPRTRQGDPEAPATRESPVEPAVEPLLAEPSAPPLEPARRAGRTHLRLISDTHGAADADGNPEIPGPGSTE